MKIDKANLLAARWSVLFKKFNGDVISLSQFIKTISENQNIHEDLDSTLIMLGQRCDKTVEYNPQKKTLTLL